MPAQYKSSSQEVKTSVLIDRSLRVSQTLTTPTTLWSFWSKLNQNTQTGHQGHLNELFFSLQFRRQTVSDSLWTLLPPAGQTIDFCRNPVPIFYMVYDMRLSSAPADLKGYFYTFSSTGQLTVEFEDCFKFCG